MGRTQTNPAVDVLSELDGVDVTDLGGISAMAEWEIDGARTELTVMSSGAVDNSSPGWWVILSNHDAPHVGVYPNADFSVHYADADSLDAVRDAVRAFHANADAIVQNRIESAGE